MLCADDVRAAALAALAVFPNERGRKISVSGSQAWRGVDHRAVISCDDDLLAPIGEDVTPRILRLVNGAVKARELFEARTEAPKAGLIHADDAPWSFDIRMRVQTLAEPKFAARAPQE